MKGKGSKKVRRIIATEDELRERIALALQELLLDDIQSPPPAADLLRPLKFILDRNRFVYWDSPLFDFRKKIEGVVEAFKNDGLTYQAYLPKALKQPKLFTAWSPATIEKNIRGVVEAFKTDGLDIETYLEAALRDPNLFNRSPKKIEKNVRGVVEAFKAEGLDVGSYLFPVLKKRPSLLSQQPVTLIRHIKNCFALYDEGKIEIGKSYGAAEFPGDKRPLLNYLMQNPEKIGYGDDNYKLRSVYGDILLDLRRTSQEVMQRPQPKIINVLRKSRRKVEIEMAGHFGHDDMSEPVRPTEDKLYRLVQQGLLKTLKRAA